MFRRKRTIKYKTGKKINPYISGELFHLYNTDNILLDEYRTSLGVEIDLPRKNSINIFYMLKKGDLNKSSSDMSNVIGINYSSKM